MEIKINFIIIIAKKGKNWTVTMLVLEDHAF